MCFFIIETFALLPRDDNHSRRLHKIAAKIHLLKRADHITSFPIEITIEITNFSHRDRNFRVLAAVDFVY